MKNLIKLVGNNAGMGMIQAMMAAAIVGGLAVAVSQIADQGAQTQTQMNAAIDKAALFMRMQSVLGSADCEDIGINSVMDGATVGDLNYSLPYLILGNDLIVFDEEYLPEELREFDEDGEEVEYTNIYKGIELVGASIAPEDEYSNDGDEYANLEIT